ncbi:hypothetical protein OS493_006557 [Desmophyllum pertusum]|uniref:Uncharacterized protein n=1 Tax=Desmophyllum pertusum TaxID=174260 RepID=A0A9X0A531_9CNID|nr:hypothetical protein OS493_006557 [Desmophyllum pertusum]
MTELSCLPVGMTSAEKNVYPVCNTDESSTDADDVTPEYFEGADPCVLTGYREMQGCGSEQVGASEEGCGEDYSAIVDDQEELSFMYPAFREFSINLLAIFEG